MKIVDSNCIDFVEVLASRAPVPGGGGAAALCGAIGTALGHMVGALTVGKKKYAGAEPEILQLMKDCEDLQKKLLELIDADAESFRPLSEAYGLPSDTEEEKQFKEERLEQCSKDACQVPLEIMRCCCRAIDMLQRYAQIGSRLALSDAGCGAALLRGALQAASLNIFINTKGIKDRAYAEDRNQEAEDMLTVYCRRAEEIFLMVKDSLQ